MKRPVPETTDRTRRTFLRQARVDREVTLTLPDGSVVKVSLAMVGKNRYPSLAINTPLGTGFSYNPITPRRLGGDPVLRDWRKTVIDNRVR